MLNDIAFGPFLEQPAGKDAIPFIIALFLHRQLHKGSGFGRQFPRRRPFAGAQAHNGAANARAVARAHFQIADQAIAFVEQRNHRHPFRHRGGPFDPAALFGHRAGARHFRLGLDRHWPGLWRTVAAREQQARRQHQSARAHHSAPGRHAS